MMSDLHVAMSSLSQAHHAEALGLRDAFQPCKAAWDNALKSIAAAADTRDALMREPCMGKRDFESYCCEADRVDSLLHSLSVKEEELWQQLTAAFHALCGFLHEQYLDRDARWARDAYGTWLEMRHAVLGRLE
jgi:uncharacterized membrane protein YccC